MRVRRAPPEFRLVAVERVVDLSPRLRRVTFTGPELEGLAVDQPAASVRLLVPSPGTDELVMPSWNGNEFLLPDGRRPAIRTFTPHLAGAEEQRLDLDVVIHGRGVASEWAANAEPGRPAAISGPGRGYEIDTDAAGFLLAGDETAIPAITQLLTAIPDGVPVQANVEIATPDARLDLPVAWHEASPDAPPGDAMVAAVRAAELPPGVRVWVAGEAAAVQRVRRYLFEERGLARRDATVRGYWKRGRAAGADED